MEQVLEIIQSALPPREGGEDDEGEIEIPLDALDTFTLRKLQKFIEVSFDIFGNEMVRGKAVASCLLLGLSLCSATYLTHFFCIVSY